jgi:hypothetical protein
VQGGCLLFAIYSLESSIRPLAQDVLSEKASLLTRPSHDVFLELQSNVERISHSAKLRA